MYKSIIKLIIVFSTLTSSMVFGQGTEKEVGFVSIFNGNDLTGWTSANTTNYFTVNHEEKAIHVYAAKDEGSDQGIDHLFYKKDYQNFILKMEFKWGEKKFLPRLNHGRDAGLLFHVHGDLNKVWPLSLEMQIGEEVKDNIPHYTTGDLWVIGKGVEVQAPQKKGLFNLNGALKTIGKSKAYDKLFTPIIAEKPSGQWNNITIIVNGSKDATFMLNGIVVNKLSSFIKGNGDQTEPLDSGRISLQAEHAEVLYRNIRIKEL